MNTVNKFSMYLYIIQPGTNNIFIPVSADENIGNSSTKCYTYIMGSSMHSYGGIYAGTGDVAHCQHSCSEKAECVAFDYNNMDRRCWLHLGKLSHAFINIDIDQYAKRQQPCRNTCEYNII